MKPELRISSLAGLLACALLLSVPARAGDCSGPDDCASIPDNGTKGACVGGVIAGYCIYERTRRKKKNGEPDLGEGQTDREDLILEGNGAQRPEDPSSRVR